MPMSDAEQIQLVKNWWQRYSYYILLLVIVFLLTGFGWRYWQRYQSVNLERSSSLYMKMVEALELQKSDEVKLFGENLIKDHKHSVYASLGALILAKDAVQVGDLKSAAERLKFVIKKSPSKKLRQLARIRQARVLIAMKKPQEALALLKSVDDEGALLQTKEAMGDALVASDVDGALKAYREADRIDQQQKRSLAPLLKIKMQQF